jgi:hypothetical protein
MFSGGFFVFPLRRQLFVAFWQERLVYNRRMNRRTFIETSVATAVLTSLSTKAFADEHKISKVGLQLYTVRDEMKKDFEGTIAKVAAIGYKEMEFAGYFGHSPKDVRAILDKNGLTSPSSHESYDTVEKKLPETLEDAHVIGQTFLVCPYIDEKMRTADGYKRVAETFEGGSCQQESGNPVRVPQPLLGVHTR